PRQQLRRRDLQAVARWRAAARRRGPFEHYAHGSAEAPTAGWHCRRLGAGRSRRGAAPWLPLRRVERALPGDVRRGPGGTEAATNPRAGLAGPGPGQARALVRARRHARQRSAIAARAGGTAPPANAIPRRAQATLLRP